MSSHGSGREEDDAMARNDVSDVELHAFADRQLSVDEENKVIDFLERHPDRLQLLRGHMDDKRRISEATELDDEPTDVAIDTLADCLGDRLARHEKREKARRWSARTVACVALIAVGWTAHTAYIDGPATRNGALTMASGEATAVPRFLADAAGAHSLFAPDQVHPVEYTADSEPAMREWFSSLFNTDIAVPHLEGIGFDLMGGRMLATAEGPLAQLLYENGRGDRVSLFFTKQQMDGSSEMKLVKVGKTFASYWQDDEFSYAVVEEAPGADIGVVATQIAELVHNRGS